jgi:hypothetical protein
MTIYASFELFCVRILSWPIHMSGVCFYHIVRMGGPWTDPQKIWRNHKSLDNLLHKVKGTFRCRMKQCRFHCRILLNSNRIWGANNEFLNPFCNTKIQRFFSPKNRKIVKFTLWKEKIPNSFGEINHKICGEKKDLFREYIRVCTQGAYILLYIIFYNDEMFQIHGWICLENHKFKDQSSYWICCICFLPFFFIAIVHYYFPIWIYGSP